MTTTTKSKEALKEQLANAKAKKVTTTVTGNSPDASKFVYVDEVMKGLDLSYLTNENIVLFGKGGHGKSEIVEWFLKNKGHEPFVQTMGSGTTQDILFGGIDLKKFNADGVIEYLVENSFMNHEYVVFEELMDAPDYILESLKDILTSKRFRNGNQVFHIKTKLIICNTNRTREEFSKNDSLKALMERFPLEFKVEWNTYNRETYGFMFQTLFGRNYRTLEYILERLAQSGTVVSPRTAVKAAKILDANGGDYSCLNFIADFSGKNSKMVKEEIAKYKTIEETEKVIEDIKDMVEQCNQTKLDNLDNIKTVKTLLRAIDKGTNDLRAKKVDDDLMKTITSNANKFEQFLIDKAKEIQTATEA